MPIAFRNNARHPLIPLLACCACIACPGKGHAAMKPQVIETRFPTEDIVIASLVVEAPSSGDATGVIQAAIDESAAAGGGVVFLPAARYRLAGSLTVKEGVTLRGDWVPPGKGTADRGTLLMPVQQGQLTIAASLDQSSGR